MNSWPHSGVKPRINVTGGQTKSNTGIDSFYDNHMSGASGPEISVGLTRTASLPAAGSWSGSADEVVAASRKTLFDPADQWQLWSGSLSCSWRTPVNDGVAWAFPLKARALHPHDSVRERVQQLPTQLQAQVVTWAEVGSGRLKDALWSAVDRYHEGPYEAGDRATSVEFSSSRYEASNTERLKQLIEWVVRPPLLAAGCT
ncbi:hypothetical protein HaLaN_06305 [Haematococcus lacustris]|uniref:Uncharacterized protein n=1 Tax=Haematococcus lacustris TaxID=44745 RepID=A0A699YLD6_HAELA|nr:hypothetical protein HaLaN_06305 [Haematococcus lacustris]